MSSDVSFPRDNERRGGDVAATSAFDGSRDHRDIRTFYTSELDYLVAMRKRYACQWCGASAMTCPSCQERNERIKELSK